LSEAAASLILVVEDDPRSRRLLRDVLGFHGYRVQEVDSGEDALAAIAVERPAAVLLDIQLPGISGFDVLARLRADQSLAGVPVVAVTASVMEHDRKRIMAAGFDHYLPKPVDLDQLLRLVAEMVAHG
jgi:CheY-like chemotaxis protein